MIDFIFTLTHGALILLFGVYLSAAFAGIQWNKKTFLNFLFLYIACAILQACTAYFGSPDLVRLLYPLITHVPTILFLHFIYHRKLTTSVISVFTAYLFCQPASWLGMLTYVITHRPEAEMIVRMAVIILTGLLTLKYIARYISDIFNKGNLRVLIFGSVPATYYLYDYATGVYGHLWQMHAHLVSEFLPFFLCIVFVVFCILYHNVYEQKTDAERKEHYLRLTTDHYKKEMEQIRQAQSQIKLLRHDMRLLLGNLAVCLDNNEHDKARELISSYSALVDETKLEYFCAVDIINHVISSYTGKFKQLQIVFTHKIEITELKVDETIFASILANALDNAVNAQEELPTEARAIKLMIKYADGKLLLSVKNPFHKKIIFVDGLPTTDKKGHGYGTQSIRYMTERLGGNCQFSVQNQVFNLRVII